MRPGYDPQISQSDYPQISQITQIIVGVISG
jgi:hypothetical protein